VGFAVSAGVWAKEMVETRIKAVTRSLSLEFFVMIFK
jgi:hypothetical protein